jgi:hypothetical protein
MEEPSAADRTMRLSNLIKTAHQLVVDSPTRLDHTHYNPEQTSGRDPEGMEWLTHRGQDSVVAAHLSTRNDCDPTRGLAPVRPSRQWVATVSGATRGHPFHTRELIYQLPPQDVRQARSGCAENAATFADLRLIMDANAARVQGLIKSGCRFSVWASLLILTIAGKVCSRMGKLP